MTSNNHTHTKNNILCHDRTFMCNHLYGAETCRGREPRIPKWLGRQVTARIGGLGDQLKMWFIRMSKRILVSILEATHKHDDFVGSAYFDNEAIAQKDSREQREKYIPLPTRYDGYVRVMLVGSTGAGKTTLLRQLIGTDHLKDRFPSTSTAKTTTAEIEIITRNQGFEAVVTFMSEHEVQYAVEECLEAACENVILDRDDTAIAGALLEHQEQRFRLSYIIGAWTPQKRHTEIIEQSEYEIDESKKNEETALSNREIVNQDEHLDNARRLREYVSRIKHIAATVHGKMGMPYQDLHNAKDRSDWMEEFHELLHKEQPFHDLIYDILQAVRERFTYIEDGHFRPRMHWPTLWYYKSKDRETFLRQVRWFSSNHNKQFGRLLTPLVNGIRVSGPFYPDFDDSNRRIVFLDGEGLGHSAKEAHSISTRVTERFAHVDMILLVDTSQSPMQAAPLELLRSVGSSGNSHKIGVAFTHFDQVKGDNLTEYIQKRNHVQASIGNAIGSLRTSLGAPATEMLDQQLRNYGFYLGFLDRNAGRIPIGFIKNPGGLLPLMECMHKFADPIIKGKSVPTFDITQLKLAVRDAADGFKKPWRGRLGLEYHRDHAKEHWARIKALSRRIAHNMADEYNELRPAADLIGVLQVSVSYWLDDPRHLASGLDQREVRTTINGIKRKVYVDLHSFVKRRLILIPRFANDWEEAYQFRGRGSSVERAQKMDEIYEDAVPSVSMNPLGPAQEFFEEFLDIVSKAVEEEGGIIIGR